MGCSLLSTLDGLSLLCLLSLPCLLSLLFFLSIFIPTFFILVTFSSPFLLSQLFIFLLCPLCLNPFYFVCSLYCNLCSFFSLPTLSILCSPFYSLWSLSTFSLSLASLSPLSFSPSLFFCRFPCLSCSLSVSLFLPIHLLVFFHLLSFTLSPLFYRFVCFPPYLSVFLSVSISLSLSLFLPHFFSMSFSSGLAMYFLPSISFVCFFVLSRSLLFSFYCLFLYFSILFFL